MWWLVRSEIMSKVRQDSKCTIFKQTWRCLLLWYRGGKELVSEYLWIQFLMWLESVKLIPELVPPLLIPHTPPFSCGWYWFVYKTILELIPLLPIPCAPPLSHVGGIALFMKWSQNRWWPASFRSSDNTSRCHTLPLRIMKIVAVCKVSVHGVESISQGIDSTISVVESAESILESYCAQPYCASGEISQWFWNAVEQLCSIDAEAGR